MMPSRFKEVDVRCLGGASPLMSNQVFTACDQRAIAWMAVVFPQLPDEDGRMAQLDALGFPETLEVADLQVVEQPHAGSPAIRRSPVSRGSSARRRAISGTRSSVSTSASARTKASA